MSEYSGCNRALGGVLRINPYNLEEITKAIDSAIQLLPEEREHRMAISF
jgi:trehalose-6-phosphate synthase